MRARRQHSVSPPSVLRISERAGDARVAEIGERAPVVIKTQDSVPALVPHHQIVAARNQRSGLRVDGERGRGEGGAGTRQPHERPCFHVVVEDGDVVTAVGCLGQHSGPTIRAAAAPVTDRDGPFGLELRPEFEQPVIIGVHHHNVAFAGKQHTVREAEQSAAQPRRDIGEHDGAIAS